MWKLTLKSIFRQLRKHYVFSGIHLLGLSVGLCCAMLLYLYIRHETGYDTGHPAADRIHRVTLIGSGQGETNYSSGTPYPLVEALRAEVPELELVSGIHAGGRGTLKTETQENYKVRNVYFADGDFLEMFDFNLQAGLPPTVLSEPGNILLSRATAATLYGEADPTGKTLRLDDKLELTVVGTYAGGEHSHLTSDVLVSLASLNEDYLGFPTDNWGVSVGGATYARLPEDYNAGQLKSGLADVVRKYMNGEEEGIDNRLWLQPLREIHFDTRFDDAMSVAPVRPVYLWVAGGIGLLILLMACFNFVNLALAQYLSKQEEVGMRKILGAGRGQLWARYWTEALVLALGAGAVSLGWLYLALPYVNERLGQAIAFDGWRDYSLFGFLAAACLAISVIAGGYPAWVVARKDAGAVLHGGGLVSDRRQTRLRKALVLAQFVITLLIISGAVTVTRQLEYMRGKDLGFRQDAIIMVPRNGGGLDQRLKEEWLRLPGVESVSLSLGAPTSRNNIGSDYYPKGTDPRDNTNGVDLKAADEDYLEHYDLELLAGRNFTGSETQRLGEAIPQTGDWRPLVINEAMAREMGYTDYKEALGRRVILGFNNMEGEVVGVVKNYHTSSLHQAVPATAVMPLPLLYYQIGVKLDPARIDATLKQLEAGYERLYPGAFFDYSFLDENVRQQYLAEDRTNALLKSFAGLAVFIACLGLFGVTAVTVRQRRREIGLRKVLGASVAGLWGLLSMDMVRLIGPALLIAAPLSWWLVGRWLNGFAYRVELNLWTLLLGAFGLLLIALLAVSGQALRAALANPMEALRE